MGAHTKALNYSGQSYITVNNIKVPPLHDVHFITSVHGYVVGDDHTVRYTSDGGQNWQVVLPDGGFGSWIPEPKTVFMRTPAAAVMAGDDSYIATISGNESTLIEGSAAGTFAYKDITMKNTSAGIVVGHDAAVGGNGAFKVTSNSGQTWSSVTAGTKLNGAYAFDNGPSYLVVGESGYVAHFNGVTSTLASTGYTAGSLTTDNLYDIHFLDSKNGYVCGENGTLLKSFGASVDATTGELTGTGWESRPLPDDLNGQTSGAAIDLYAVGHPKSDKVFYGGKYEVFAGIQECYARRTHDESGKFASYFWYDALGRIVASQNAKQANQNPKKYSYTLFDELGRVVEAGEKEENHADSIHFEEVFGTYISNYFNPDMIDDSLLNVWVTDTSGGRYEVTHSYYDDTAATVLPYDFTQNNLRKRISYTTYEEEYDDDSTTYDHATFYDYDIHGNVKSIVHENPNIDIDEQQFKKIDYTYDLISGNVHQVAYQPGRPDEYYHKYSYDADNRLTEVKTSRDSLIFETEAKYFYYDHGPLARVELGPNQSQGVDYAYTLQGWIKGVNSNSLSAHRDIGQDGDTTSTNPNQLIARDAFGYSLGYYSGDYSPIDTTNKWMDTEDRFIGLEIGSDLLASRNDMFNGNIGHMTTTLSHPETWQPLAQGTAYGYDQLNRLIEMKAFANFNKSVNEWNSGSTYQGRYNNKFKYDASGNILAQYRNNMAGETIDSLTYRYQLDGNGDLMRNRLYHVNDTVNAVTFGDDIDDMGTFDASLGGMNVNNNYRYDEIGQLIQDEQEEIDTIIWTVSGKVKEVRRPLASSRKNLIFDYDAMGQRIAKHTYEPDGTWIKSKYYVRDAQGNVLSVYDNYNVDSTSTQHFKTKEMHLYGSSRLGMNTRELELIGADTLAPDTGYFNYLGLKQYELSNHLGNVLALVSDRVEYVEDSTYWISTNGTDEYVGTGSTFDFGLTDEVTIEAWVKTTDNANPGLIVSNYAPGDDKGVHLLLRNGIPEFMGRTGHGTGNHTVITGTTAINDDEWHHVVGTVKIDHYKLFVDGVKVAESTPTFTTADLSGSRDFRVARSIHAGYYIDAEIREASMWKRAKTESEVASNFFQEYSPTADGLVHYWKLDDNSNTIKNQVNGAPDGIAYNNPTWIGNYAGEYYRPDIQMIADYSPFGAPLHERSINSDESSYGFNGMEKDDEIKGAGNSYDFGARIYDPRLGRWLSVDPKKAEYTSVSGYNSMANNPIIFKDPEGLEPLPTTLEYAVSLAAIYIINENLNSLENEKSKNMKKWKESIESYSYLLDRMKSINEGNQLPKVISNLEVEDFTIENTEKMLDYTEVKIKEYKSKVNKLDKEIHQQNAEIKKLKRVTFAAENGFYKDKKEYVLTNKDDIEQWNNVPELSIVDDVNLLIKVGKSAKNIYDAYKKRRNFLPKEFQEMDKDKIIAKLKYLGPGSSVKIPLRDNSASGGAAVFPTDRQIGWVIFTNTKGKVDYDIYEGQMGQKKEDGKNKKNDT